MFLQLSYLFEPRAKEDAPAAMAAPQAQVRMLTFMRSVPIGILTRWCGVM
jgi:hypothetical protein